MQVRKLSMICITNFRFFRDCSHHARNTRIHPQSFFNATVEVLEVGRVLRRTLAVAVFKYFVHFVEQ